MPELFVVFVIWFQNHGMNYGVVKNEIQKILDKILDFFAISNKASS